MQASYFRISPAAITRSASWRSCRSVVEFACLPAPAKSAAYQANDTQQKRAGRRNELLGTA